MKNLFFIIFFLGLIGCASSSKVVKISNENLADFWTVGDGNTKSASVFFVCGTLKSGYTEALSMKTKLGICELNLDGKNYGTIEKNTIGKINISPGTYSAKWGVHKMDAALGVSPEAVNFKAGPGDILLLTANHSAMMVLSHRFTIKVDYLKNLQELGSVRSYIPIEMQ